MRPKMMWAKQEKNRLKLINFDQGLTKQKEKSLYKLMVRAEKLLP